MFHQQGHKSKSILAFLVAAGVSQFANAACLPIFGTVQLSPEQPGVCTIATLPGMEGQPFIGECFALTLKLAGFAKGHGHSGVTSEPVASLFPGGGVGMTPATAQGGRNVLTARSTFSLGGTRFYAAEVIIDSNGKVTEQSIITGTDGKGMFKNASGVLTILGNSVGQPAQVRGEICTQ